MPAPRRPHHISLRELGRIGFEHVLGLWLLLAGLILFTSLREHGLAASLTSALAFPGLDWLLAMLQLRHAPSVLIGAVLWDVFAMAALQYTMRLHGLYDRHAVRRPRNELLRFLRSAVVAGILVSVAFFTRDPSR